MNVPLDSVDAWVLLVVRISRQKHRWADGTDVSHFDDLLTAIGRRTEFGGDWDDRVEHIREAIDLCYALALEQHRRPSTMNSMLLDQAIHLSLSIVRFRSHAAVNEKEC